MEARKKIVICSKCKYFPTKVDQSSSHQLQVGSQSIQWTCQACHFQNIFPKSEFIMLPERNYLKFHHTGLLSSQSKKRTYNLLAILQNAQQDTGHEVVYTVPLDKVALEEQLKRDLGMFHSYRQLQEKSSWLRFYRKRKAALMKFTQIKLESNQKIFRDEYSIYLLEKYLKNEIIQMSEEEEIEELRVEIILQAKERLFYFQLDSLELDMKESSLQRFLTLYLLSVLKQQPTWASQLYSKQIQFHQKKPSLKQYYQKLIVFREGSEDSNSSIFIKKHIFTSRSPNIIPEILSNRTSKISNSNFQQFEQYPLSEFSFLQAIRPKMKKYVHLTESVDIFCSARRSKVIERITLTKNLSSLREVLLNPKEYRIGVSEEELKKLIGSQMESIKGNKFMKLIKLVGNFAVDGSRVFVLYTFDWEKLENKKEGASFEEPKTYRDVLREEVLKEKPEKNVNPFAKKKKKVEVVEIWTVKPQKEDHDYISL